MKKFFIHLILVMFLISTSIAYVSAQDTLSKKDKGKKEQVKKEQVKKDNKKPQKKEASKKNSKKKSSKKSDKSKENKGKALAKGHDKKSAPQNKKQQKADADSIK